MTLLTQPAIDVLEQLAGERPGWWTNAGELDYHARAELERAGLIEVSRPPATIGRPAWTAQARPRATRVRITERGRERLAAVRGRERPHREAERRRHRRLRQA